MKSVNSTYKPLRNDEERRHLLCQFAIDPDEVIGRETVSVSAKRQDKKVEVWVTECQLAGPMFMNSPQHASIMTTSMASRPFKTNEALRNTGVLPYCHCMEETCITDEIRQQCDVEGTASVDKADFGKINEAMRTSLDKPEVYSDSNFVDLLRLAA